MAKKQIKEKAIEEALWESANKLRGSVEPSEYKHVVLSLIFLKYANDRFTERRNELVADDKEAFADNPVFYNAKNVFYLEPESRWDYLIEVQALCTTNTNALYWQYKGFVPMIQKMCTTVKRIDNK